MSPLHRRLFWVAPALLLVAMARPSLAQVGVVVQGGAVKQDQMDDDEEAAGRQQQQEMGNVNFGIDDSNLDAWIFNGRASGNGQEWFLAQLDLKLEEVSRVCSLTDPQKLKLRLAGRGDMKRFFDIYDEKRKKFQALKNDQNKINEIFQEIRPLQEKLNKGVFGPGSIFDKTLKVSLTPDQAVRYDEVDRDRRLYRFRARLELVVMAIDSSVGLAEDQRNKFLDLLKAETKPPTRSGMYEYYLVMYLAAKVPRDKMKPIFDDAQWKVVSQLFDQAKGYEQFLKTYGLLDPGEEKSAEEQAKEKPKPVMIGDD